MGTALHLDILINTGISTGISPMMPSNTVAAIKKYNGGALSFDIKVCKTNHSTKSAMRAPGRVQASLVAEAIMEHVASVLSMEVDSVRNKNLHTFESLSVFYGDSAGEALEYTMPAIWDKLAISSSLAQRRQMIEQFNLRRIWQKRGISRIPIMYQVTVRPSPGKVSILRNGTIVVEVGGIELGQGLWTKVKQMTAYALSSIVCDGTEDLVEKVRVVQSDSLSLVQGGLTAGSTTSESSCEAVRLCCNILVERLSPLKKKLQEQMCPINWKVLILQAHLQAVNMAANSYFVHDSSSVGYLNYGAAVSEVEIEGAFVQGFGFFMHEEFLTNTKGLAVTNSTWTYKIPTIDTIPRQLNVEVLSSGNHQKRVLSSEASSEPPFSISIGCPSYYARCQETLRSR